MTKEASEELCKILNGMLDRISELEDEVRWLKRREPVANPKAWIAPESHFDKNTIQ